MLRPALHADLSRGLLSAEHFQVAYATSDIEQAQALFGDRFGMEHWTQLEGQLPAGGEIRVELAWVGTVMYELMWSRGPGSAIYMDRLPDKPGFHLKHHHLGYLVDEAGWDALIQTVEREGHAMPHVSHNTGFMKSCFVDAPELGHYLEYICPAEAGSAFFKAVARN